MLATLLALTSAAAPPLTNPPTAPSAAELADTGDSATGGADMDEEGCRCDGGGPTPAGSLALVVLVGLARRRRSASRCC